MPAAPTGYSSPERDYAVTRTLLDSMESQLIALYVEKEQMQHAVGVSDASEVIARIQRLEERLRQHEPDFQYPVASVPSRPADPVLPLGDTVQDLSQHIRLLSSMVHSMEAQLNDVYADREMLYRAGGIQESQDVLVHLNEKERLQVQISHLEEQLAAMETQKTILAQGLGTTDANEIIALFRSISDAMETAHRVIHQLLPTNRMSSAEK